MNEKLDKFNEVIIDSTAVEANTRWPTDSKILIDLLRRAFYDSQKLSIFGVENFKPFWLPNWIKKMESINYKINITQGKKKSKGKIKRGYRRLLKTAQKAHDYLVEEIERISLCINAVDICPSLRKNLESMWKQINNDVLSAGRVLYYTGNRIFNGIILKASERILSISDRSAAFIQKGNREAVIGYKPQIARSGKGFIPGLVLPEGNTNDSVELIPLVRAVINRTGVVPEVVSTDDGYTSGDNRKELLEMGVRVVSMNGAKGKELIPGRSWNSESYKNARNKRSAVESTIFTLKYTYEFGGLRRRGIEGATAELFEKVIAYNFAHAIRVREAKKKPKQKRKRKVA